jgi:hypothetical protein
MLIFGLYKILLKNKYMNLKIGDKGILTFGDKTIAKVFVQEIFTYPALNHSFFKDSK